MDLEKESKCERCIIRKLNAFRKLDKKTLSKISDVKQIKSIKKGDNIFEEGQNLDGIYCVKKGNSKLFKMNENGKDQIVRIVSKGELLGQRSILANEPTNLNARAINDMEVCFVPKSHLSELHQNKGYIEESLIHLAEELKKSNNKTIDMAQKSVKQRIAKTILHLDNYGCDDKGYIKLVLSREEISSVVGTAKESCIRALSLMKKDNLISFSGKKIKILNREKLQQISDPHL